MGWAAPIVAGIGQNQVDQAQKAQYEFNAKSELIAADQDAASRLNDLNSTMSSINAIEGSRGLTVSPTSMAIQQGLTKKTDANIKASQLNYATRAQSDMFGAWGADQAGQYALYGGFLKSLNALGQDAAAAG